MFKTIFLGTPEFVIPSLEALLEHPKIDLVQIISSPDTKSGRGMQIHSPPVASFAKSKNILLLQTANINRDINKLVNADLIICFAFSQFLNQKILDHPRLGAFNIHTSILPKYRGAAPIHYALLHNDKETGVTIQKMALKMDSGDIAYQKVFPIYDQDDYPALLSKFTDTSKRGLVEFLDNFENLKFTPQPDTFTLAPIIKKEDGVITENTTYQEFLGKFRAFKLWPQIFFIYQNTPIKILNFSPSSMESKEVLQIINNQLILKLKDKSIQITSLQIPSKSALSDKAMLNSIKQFFKGKL